MNLLSNSIFTVIAPFAASSHYAAGFRKDNYGSLTQYAVAMGTLYSANSVIAGHFNFCSDIASVSHESAATGSHFAVNIGSEEPVLTSRQPFAGKTVGVRK